jgi:hypothetical protein
MLEGEKVERMLVVILALQYSVSKLKGSSVSPGLKWRFVVKER